MDEILQPAITAAADRYGAELDLFRGQTILTIQPENITAVLQMLRDEFQFNMLMDVTAVDYFPKTDPRFTVVYHLYSMPNNLRMELRVPVAAIDPHVETAERVFPGANWYEREVWDLFGIRFDGHSDLRRIMMPHDWEGHPLRKDYPLGYEEVQFTFSIEDIDLRKPDGKREG